MKLAIVGSREFKYIDFAVDIIYKYLIIHQNEENFYLISGGAKGIDTVAERIAKDLNLNTKIFLPDWNKYGKRAGFLRNELIIKESTFVLALWDGISKGTKNSIDLAIKFDIPIDIYIRK